MDITCLSDLHGHYPELEGGDILIVAGDLTASDRYEELSYFEDWLRIQPYKCKIVVAGNHDNQLQRNPSWLGIPECVYLCDSGTEFQYEEFEPCNFCGERKKCQQTSICSPPLKKKFKIWGSPWILAFSGMNPKYKAFTVDTDEELAEKWSTCPLDVDILICHGPPYGILDENKFGESCGSMALRELMFKVKPSLMIFGHIHEWGGKSIDLSTTFCVNASYVNERYEPKNKAIRIEFDKTNKRVLRLN